jgi:hypothetical protein
MHYSHLPRSSLHATGFDKVEISTGGPLRGCWMRRLAAHLGRRLVLAEALVNHLAQEIVVGPGEIFDLGNQLGPHPMHAAEDQRRAEAALAGGGTASGISEIDSGCRRRRRRTAPACRRA